jgi:hypothetical protein
MTKNCISIVINQFEGLENHDNVVNGKMSPNMDGFIKYSIVVDNVYSKRLKSNVFYSII